MKKHLLWLLALLSISALGKTFVYDSASDAADMEAHGWKINMHTASNKFYFNGTSDHVITPFYPTAIRSIALEGYRTEKCTRILKIDSLDENSDIYTTTNLDTSVCVKINKQSEFFKETYQTSEQVHSISIRCTDGRANCYLTKITVVVDDLPQLDPPEPLEPTNVSYTNLTANWLPVENAFAYHLHVASNEVELAESPFTILSNDEAVVSYDLPVAGFFNYSYWVSSVSIYDIDSELSTTQSVDIALGTPAVTEASDLSYTSFTANWTAVDGPTAPADGYRVVVEKLDEENSAWLPFCESNLVEGTSVPIFPNSVGTYRYQVFAQALNSYEEILESPPSAWQEVKITYPPIEGFKLSSKDFDTYTLQWDLSPYAVRYLIVVAGPDGQPAVQYTVDGTNNTFTATNQGLGLYSAAIVGIAEDGRTSFDAPYISYTLKLAQPSPTLPNQLDFNTFSSNSFTISWGAVPGADHYEVIYAIDGGESFTNLTSDCSLFLDNLTSTNWSYTVQAVAADGIHRSSRSSSRSINLAEWVEAVLVLPLEYSEEGFVYSASFEPLLAGTGNDFIFRNPGVDIPGWEFYSHYGKCHRVFDEGGGTYALNTFLYDSPSPDGTETNQVVALGGRSTGTSTERFAVAFTNCTGHAITSMSLDYDIVLHWRNTQGITIKCFYRIFDDDDEIDIFKSYTAANEIVDLRYEYVLNIDIDKITPESTIIEFPKPIHNGKRVQVLWVIERRTNCSLAGIGNLNIAFTFSPEEDTGIDEDQGTEDGDGGEEEEEEGDSDTWTPTTDDEGYEGLAYGKPGAADTVVDRKGYALGYIEQHEQSAWVAYRLTKEDFEGKRYGRASTFYPDPAIETGSATSGDYSYSGYDRGHLAAAADMAYDPETEKDSFYMSNISPQLPSFNRGIWKTLEGLVRSFATAEGSIFVVTGPILHDGLEQKIGRTNQVSVPEAFYKVVFDETPPYKMIGFILPNSSSCGSLTDYICTVDEVEKQTGLNFFSKLPKRLQSSLESRVDGAKWNANWNVEIQEDPDEGDGDITYGTLIMVF